MTKDLGVLANKDFFRIDFAAAQFSKVTESWQQKTWECVSDKCLQHGARTFSWIHFSYGRDYAIV